MSQFSHRPPAAPAARGSSGLAIAALVCGCLGLIIPGLGIVAVILGIVALTKASTPPGAKGMAIGGIAVGAVSLITMFLCMGIMLPAIGQARYAARQAISQSQLRQVGIAMSLYADQNQQWFPESSDGLDRLVASGLLSPADLISPHAAGQPGVSYIYVPVNKPSSEYDDPSQTVVAYQNPSIVRRDLATLFMDGHVDELSLQELNQRLAAQGAAAAPQRSNR